MSDLPKIIHMKHFTQLISFLLWLFFENNQIEVNILRQKKTQNAGNYIYNLFAVQIRQS